MKIKELFEIRYGVNLELNKLELASNDDDGVNFVSRTSQNNGVVARVKRIQGVKPSPAGSISCAAGGSVLSTFVQPEPFYSGRDLYILTPIREMTFAEKLYYVHLLSENKYKYSYGRQANKTLGDIELPDLLPDWLSLIDLQSFSHVTLNNNIENSLPLDVSSWEPFSMCEIFNFSKGKRLTKEDMIEGKLNYIGAISDNNGIREHIDANPTHGGNSITVNYNGSVGEAFFQDDAFWASDDVNVLTLKHSKLNVYIGLFLCTVIKSNKFRFGYGRKWTLEKMKETILYLPVDGSKKPNWSFMEMYIKQLPYAEKI